MKIKRNAQAQKRGLDRFDLDLSAEHKRGLVPQRYVRKDATGRPFTTKTAAKEHWDKVLAPQISSGGVADDEKTFADAVGAWEKHLDEEVANGGLFEATKRENLASVQNHILNSCTLRGVEIGKVRLSSIDHRLLRDELIRGGQLLGLNLSRHSVIKLLQRLKKIFEIAVLEKWITANPATLLTIPAWQTDPLDKALDPKIYGRFSQDLPALFDALRCIAPQYVLPLQVARWTGVRVGELRALTVQQVAATNQLALVKINRAWKNNDSAIGKVKGPRGRERSRQVPIELEESQQLFEHALREGVRDDQLLFGNWAGKIRKPMNENSLRHAWYQAQFAVRGWLFCRSSNTRDTGRAYRLIELPKPIQEFTSDEFDSFRFGQSGLAKGVERNGLCFATIEEAAAHIRLTLFGLHDLRHLYASELFAQGLELRDVASMIGDTEETTTKHYLHFIQKGVEKLQVILQARRAAAEAV